MKVLCSQCNGEVSLADLQHASCRARFTESEQRLVDIMFSIALLIYHKRTKPKTEDECAQWIAQQLALCGFPTQRVGSSWGVLPKR